MWSWDKSFACLPVFLWVARALPGLVLSWRQYRGLQGGGWVRDRAAAAMLYQRHTQISAFAFLHTPRLVCLCVFLVLCYFKFVINDGVVDDAISSPDLYYNIWRNILSPGYTYVYTHTDAHTLFVLQGQLSRCSVQCAGVVVLELMQWVLLNIICSPVNVSWDCLHTKDSAQRPRRQALEICDPRLHYQPYLMLCQSARLIYACCIWFSSWIVLFGELQTCRQEVRLVLAKWPLEVPSGPALLDFVLSLIGLSHGKSVFIAQHWDRNRDRGRKKEVWNFANWNI